jgi:GAF domain-containing protein
MPPPGWSPISKTATGSCWPPFNCTAKRWACWGWRPNTKETTPWSDDDIRLLEEVSLQVSLAIENARLLQQTQEQANELSILFEATRQLAETIDLQAIYKILNAQTINYVNANRSTVLLLNPARTHFEAIVSHHRDSHGQPVFTPITRMETVEDNMVLGWLLKNPAMLIHHLDDPSLPPEVQQYMTRLPETKIFSLTYFPLIVRSRLVGVMEVEHFYQRHLYTPNELQLAQAIISQVTVAIENAQLFQQTQIALENTQNLYQISRSLVESTSLDEVFNIILETVKSYQVDRVSISLINRGPTGEIEQSTIAASWDRDPAYQLPIGTAFSTKNFSLVSAFSKPPFHPLISHDLRQPHGQDERMDNAFREYVVNGLNAVTLFSAPMFLGAEYKGVLSIYTRQPHQYTEEEIRVYQTLADQAIIAIENYRLLNATRLERDRASLLYELGRSLSYTTSVEDVQR